MEFEEVRQEESDRALEWVKEKWTQSKQCPICGERNWNVGTVGEIRSFNGGDMILGGPRAELTPVFPVLCTNCGYMHLFNALLAGIVRGDDYRPADRADS